MTTQREGFLGDIVDKVKDLLDGPDPKKTPEPEDPPLVPQCCGQPPGHPLVGEPRLLLDGAAEHDRDCPNHPDNLAKDEVVAG
jgi:hypothetical protein